MIVLKCGCMVDDDGTFVVGQHCRESRCRECNSMPDLHPFGNGRLKDIV